MVIRLQLDTSLIFPEVLNSVDHWATGRLIMNQGCFTLWWIVFLRQLRLLATSILPVTCRTVSPPFRCFFISWI